MMELEHCLVDLKNKESRVRVIQIVRLKENINVFCQKWYGPFRNGEQLGGCSICDSAFALTVTLKGSEVTGVWHGLHAVGSFDQSQFIQEVQVANVRKIARDEKRLVLLLKQLWCSINVKLIVRWDGC